MFKKKAVSLFLVTALASLTLLAGCSGSKAPEKAEDTAKKAVPAKTLRIATTLTEGNPSVESLQIFAKLVNEKSNGSLDVKVFGNSKLPGNTDALEGVKAGTLEMSMTSAPDISQFAAKFGALALPYVFDSDEKMHKALDGEPGQIMAKELDDKGLKMLYWLDGGSRSVINNVRPINKPEDLKGLKIRVMPSKMSVDLMNKMGAIATPMGQGEVYSALQQKVLDGWENSPQTLLSLKLYEVSKYYSWTKHLMVPDALIMNKKVFEGLTPDQQKIVVDAAKEAQTKQRELWKASTDKTVEELKAKGVIFNDITDLKPFQEAVKPVWKDYTDKNGTELVDKITSIK